MGLVNKMDHNLAKSSVIRQKGEYVRLRIREEMFVFRKIWSALFSWNTRFDIL